MNSFATLCLFIFLATALYVFFLFYIIRSGWGSRWLLATSVTIFMLLIFIPLWLTVQEDLFLFIGLGFSVLSGIAFYIYLRTSPISDILTGKNQNMQSQWATLSERERNSRKESTKLAVRDIFLIGFLQNLPLIIGVAILILNRDAQSYIITSIALFIIGVTGILRVVLRPKHVLLELKHSKGKMIGNILVTVFAWSLALYNLFNG